MKFKIGIVGNGYVGKATRLLECDDIQCTVYDKDPEKCDPVGTTPKDLKGCDFVFVCVPTPMKKNGVCDLSIVKDAIKTLTKNGIRKKKIIIRSTVPVGTSSKIGVNFMPEFLTEKNWKDDFYNNNMWIFGVDSIRRVSHENEVLRIDNTILKLNNLIRTAHKNDKIKNPETHFTFASNAELIKYGRNSFLAVKVSVFNEIEEFCLKNDLNFKVVRELICADTRIGDSHSYVPGPDGKRGFGGTCFPKDISSLVSQMQKSKVKTMVLKASKERNEKLDRPQKDWEKDKGRAVSE